MKDERMVYGGVDEYRGEKGFGVYLGAMALYPDTCQEFWCMLLWNIHNS
jgi:hypothetical protein